MVYPGGLPSDCYGGGEILGDGLGGAISPGIRRRLKVKSGDRETRGLVHATGSGNGYVGGFAWGKTNRHGIGGPRPVCGQSGYFELYGNQKISWLVVGKAIHEDPTR